MGVEKSQMQDLHEALRVFFFWDISESLVLVGIWIVSEHLNFNKNTVFISTSNIFAKKMLGRLSSHAYKMYPSLLCPVF